MPSVKDKSTVEAIAREYCSNGRNEEKGLLAVGYSKNYARAGAGNKVYSNVLVKAAIARIDAKTEKKQAVDRQYCIDKLQHIVENSPTERNRLTALSLIGDFTGAKRDKAPNTEKIAEMVALMSEEEIQTRRIVAKMRTNELSDTPEPFPRLKGA